MSDLPPGHPTDDELPEVLPLLRRAHRIEVDCCAACPFAEWWIVRLRPGQIGDDRERLRCEHPLTIAKPAAMPYVNEAGPPPEWCPLRGALTLVAGPRTTENHDSRSSSEEP